MKIQERKSFLFQMVNAHFIGTHNQILVLTELHNTSDVGLTQVLAGGISRVDDNHCSDIDALHRIVRKYKFGCILLSCMNGIALRCSNGADLLISPQSGRASSLTFPGPSPSAHSKSSCKKKMTAISFWIRLNIASPNSLATA
jgi:hypothetical protein